MIPLSLQYLLGIDIGTSSSKIALFSADGEQLFQHTAAYSTIYEKPGYAEQDPNVWWQSVCASIRLMFSETGINAKQIVGIGIDGQSGAMIPVNKSGTVLRNAMLWLDRRSEPQYEMLKQTVGEQKIFAVSGNPLSPSYITGKVLWMKQHEPDLFRQTYKIMQSNSYIVYKLTGEFSQDHSQGNGFHCYNIADNSWDYDLAEQMQLPGELLPDVYACSDVVGTVTAEASDMTGLATGTPVVAGGLDAACATLGAGAIQSGQVQEQGGQAGGMSIVMDKPFMHQKLILSAHVVPNKWILQGGTVGGGSLNWLKREFGQEMKADFFTAVNEGAARIPPGSEGLLYLPYMAGERSPIWDPSAKGVFIGLSYDKTKAHLFRAVMEGCAFALQHNLLTAEQSGVRIDTLHGVGGAANSILWTQIKSDITGKRMLIPSVDSSAALGAALLAGVGVGVYRDFVEATERTIRVQREHIPNQAHKDIYDAMFSIH